MNAEVTVGEGRAVLQSHNVCPRQWRGCNDSTPLIRADLCINKPPAPLPFQSAHTPSTAQPHCHAPQGQPALECHSWGRISPQALSMSHVSQREREREKEGESMTGEVSHPSKTITGRCFNVCLGVSDRFPDYKFKLIRLTRSGHGALLSPH